MVWFRFYEVRMVMLAPRSANGVFDTPVIRLNLRCQNLSNLGEFLASQRQRAFAAAQNFGKMGSFETFAALITDGQFGNACRSLHHA